MVHGSSENIAEALKILEDAARQKKDELRAAISDKYTNLRSLIMENESSLMNSLATTKDDAIEAISHVKDASMEKIRELARDVDKGVHQNPWPCIAVPAVLAVVLGYILGRRRK